MGLGILHLPMVREGSDTLGLWRIDVPAEKTMSHNHHPMSIKHPGKGDLHIHFSKELPELCMAPPRLWAFALSAALCFLHSVYPHPCSSPLLTLESAPICSIAFPSSSPPALCSQQAFQPEFARLLSDMTSGQCANMLQRCCFLLG